MSSAEDYSAYECYLDCENCSAPTCLNDSPKRIIPRFFDLEDRKRFEENYDRDFAYA